MGLDMYLIAAHNIKECKKANFWRDLPDFSEIELYSENYDYNKPAILVYWRKFWELHKFLMNEEEIEDHDNGVWIEVNKERLEKIINFAAHHPDYGDSFDSLPQLCITLYNYDKLRENGLRLFYEGDY